MIFILKSIFSDSLALRVSNGWDPDQGLYYVHPDLGPNRLQRLSPDDKSPLASKELSKQESTVGNTYFLARAVLVLVVSVKAVVFHRHPGQNSNYEMTLGTHEIIACHALTVVMILRSLSLEIHPYMVSLLGMSWC